MAIYQLKLSDIGEGVAESEVAVWHVAVGDVVKEDQTLVDMLTDKAAVEIPSPVSGRVAQLHAAVGDKVAVGAPLVSIEIEGEVAAEEPTMLATPEPAKPTPAPAAAVASAPVAPPPVAAAVDDYYEPRPAAAPSVRLRARQMGIDLCRVRGSGTSGRVLLTDLERYAAAAAAPPVGAPIAVAADGEGVQTFKLVGLRRRIAEAMERSTRRIPHFAYVEEVDVTELEALRQHLNQRHGAARGKLTLLPFIMRALIRALPQYPQINSTYDDESGLVSRYSAVHVGIATQTDNGLVVPVVRNAQALDPWQAAREVSRLAEAARKGKATRQELSGSTLTITSLGKLGGIATTPVINAPEVAIIGVNAMVDRPVVRNGQVAVRTMMNLSSSFDHRIVDGFDAASFIHAVKDQLEHPATLFIA